MKKKSMIVFDSGVGGLNVFVKLIRRYPYDDFFYLSDSVNTPYGEKNADELLSLSVDAIGERMKNADGLILACNTLSSNCADSLEKIFAKPVFGIKPQPNVREPTLILCTRATARACEKTFSSAPLSETFVPEKWVETIEEDLPRINDEFFRSSLKRFSGKRYAAVLLGCTHFIYVKRTVQSVFPSARLLDGTERLFEKTDRFLTKSLGRTATARFFDKITRKNFLGGDSERNFELFRCLTDSKSH